MCPALLKREGKSVEELGAVEVQDLALHMDLDDEARDNSPVTVQFHNGNQQF